MTLVARSIQTVYVGRYEASQHGADGAAAFVLDRARTHLPNVSILIVKPASYRGGFYVTIEHDTFTTDGRSTGVAIKRHVIRHARVNKPYEDRFNWSKALREGRAIFAPRDLTPGGAA